MLPERAMKGVLTSWYSEMCCSELFSLAENRCGEIESATSSRGFGDRWSVVFVLSLPRNFSQSQKVKVMR